MIFKNVPIGFTGDPACGFGAAAAPAVYCTTGFFFSTFGNVHAPFTFSKTTSACFLTSRSTCESAYFFSSSLSRSSSSCC